MKLQTVQALRGLAALIVVLSHIRAIDAKYTLTIPAYPGYWYNGASGVDLFFVISGFIMVWVAGQAPRGKATSGAFLFARAGRIYPLWWFFASLIAVYYTFVNGIPFDVGRTMAGTVVRQDPWLHLLNSYLLLPQPNWPILGVGWTLVHEMYFYIVFAGILLLPRRWMVAVLMAWLVMVIAGSNLGLSGNFARNYVELLFYPMTAEFILGAFAAILIQRGYRVFSRSFLIIGLLVFGLDFVIYDFNAGWQPLGWGRVLAFGLPATLLLYGLVSLEVAGRQFVPRFLVSLGDWSYALYLVHTLIIAALARIWFPYVTGAGRAGEIAFLVLCLITTIAAAAFSYRFLERPMIRWFGIKRSALFGKANAGLKPGPIEPGVW